MAPRTPKEQAAYDLETLDDRICDLLSGMDGGRLYHNISAPERERIQEFLDKWLHDFRIWRDDNDLNYLP